MHDHDLDRRLLDLAGRQHRCLTRAQARVLGATPKQLRARVESPQWSRFTSRVLCLSGGPPSPQTRCMAAALDVGGVISHHTAAALYGLPGFPLGAVHVSRQKDGCRRTSTIAVVHRPRWLPDRHTTVLDGIPLTTVARTLFDLATVVHWKRLDRAIENALNHKLVTLEALRTLTAEMARRGREGSRVMVELVGKRLPGYVPLESDLERLFLEVVEQSGLPAPVRQLDVGGERWVGRVDFAWPERRLIVEVDGDRYHGGLLDHQADAERDAALRAAGYRVEHVEEGHLVGRPEDVQACLLRWWRAAAPCGEGTARVPER